MQRKMIDFDRDDEGDWFAWLDCGHTQHVRHRPPFIDRPWVTTAAGRQSRLGRPLDCVRCDRFERPAAVVCYKRTPIFDEQTIPAGLRREHATRAGVWAEIEVLDGRLRYVVPMYDMDSVLSPAAPGVVVPEVKHYVELQDHVRFRLAMYRLPKNSRRQDECG